MGLECGGGGAAAAPGAPVLTAAVLCERWLLKETILRKRFRGFLPAVAVASSTLGYFQHVLTTRSRTASTQTPGWK